MVLAAQRNDGEAVAPGWADRRRMAVFRARIGADCRRIIRSAAGGLDTPPFGVSSDPRSAPNLLHALDSERGGRWPRLHAPAWSWQTRFPRPWSSPASGTIRQIASNNGSAYSTKPAEWSKIRYMSENPTSQSQEHRAGEEDPGSSPKDRLRISNEVSSHGGLILPVHRSVDYVVISPHTVATGLVGDGSVPRVSLRLLRQDRRTEHLERPTGWSGGPYKPLERLAFVEVAEIEIDLGQAARLVDALVAVLERLHPGLLNVFGIALPNTSDDAPASNPERHVPAGGSSP